MTVIYIIFGAILTAVFFLNIKTAASVLCRIVGGFAFLYIYNSVAYALPLLGITVISAAVCGILGLPGLGLLICLGLL